MEYQHTIKNEVSISEVGLHTNNKVKLTLPALLIMVFCLNELI